MLVKSSPKILYRYRPALVRELDALCGNKLYLSAPSGFDDPWDCALIDSEAARDAVNSLRVACFATNDFDPRFWSHYASSHNGICVGYHVDQLPVDISYFYKVQYSDVHPGFPKGVKMRSPDAYDAAAKLLTTKCDAWGPQQEWRFIVPATANTFIEHPQDAVASVTFGVRTHQLIRQHLINRLGFNPSIEFRVICKEDGVMTPQVKAADDYPDEDTDSGADGPYSLEKLSGWA